MKKLAKLFANVLAGVILLSTVVYAADDVDYEPTVPYAPGVIDFNNVTRLSDITSVENGIRIAANNGIQVDTAQQCLKFTAQYGTIYYNFPRAIAENASTSTLVGNTLVGKCQFSIDINVTDKRGMNISFLNKATSPVCPIFSLVAQAIDGDSTYYNLFGQNPAGTDGMTQLSNNNIPYNTWITVKVDMNFIKNTVRYRFYNRETGIQYQSVVEETVMRNYQTHELGNIKISAPVANPGFSIDNINLIFDKIAVKKYPVIATDGTNLTATAIVRNEFETEIVKPNLFLCIYDGEDNLVGVAMDTSAPAKLAADTDYTLTCSIPNPGTGYTAKAYLWTGDSLKPFTGTTIK